MSRRRTSSPPQKKKWMLAGGAALFLWALYARAARGSVLIGPVTVTQLPKVTFDKQTNADVQRLTLALLRVRQLLGWDPNTLVTKAPASPADEQFITETIALNQKLSNQTAGVVPWPTNEMKMLALAKKLPGAQMLAVNQQFYSLLGIDVSGANEPTRPLTPATEQVARTLIAKWRPYSADAVDNLFAMLDLARELGGQA